MRRRGIDMTWVRGRRETMMMMMPHHLEQWGGWFVAVLSVLNPTHLPCYITSPYSHSHTTTYLHTSIVSPYKGHIHGLLH